MTIFGLCSRDMHSEGFEHGGLLTPAEAMECFLQLLYAGQKLGRKTWEKRTRDLEIYHRYLAGEDSMVLARAFDLSDRRVRSIITKERNRK